MHSIYTHGRFKVCSTYYITLSIRIIIIITINIGAIQPQFFDI